MEIKNPAVSGTLESSDAQVMVEPGRGTIEIYLESSVINQYGNRIKRVVMETLLRLEVDNVKITVVDKGALDCTIKARVEGAVFRSFGLTDNLPWGGMIRP
ncbi:citrate lyase acyl carrier protein [Lacrimispora sp.]|uniref:citrate lyase acyl carrier protein n=1 Tax=Lacrimispora sp. TaxID=2719234 RepID=UPI0028A0B4C1|nr:citrate lyase acyl carrier protein [Lacrimispora sp.]